jgi:hypothetical protein
VPIGVACRRFPTTQAELGETSEGDGKVLFEECASEDVSNSGAEGEGVECVG